MPPDREASRRILIALERDLATRTESEVAGQWTGAALVALERVRPGYFDKVIRGHNPIYHIAKRVWFDNGERPDGTNDYLDPEFHRDRICKELLDYWLAPPHEWAGLLLMAQRESYKTTFAHGAFAHFVAFREKYVNQYDARIMFMHHKEDMAMQNVEAMKEKSVYSPWMRQVWSESPWVFASSEDWDTKKGFRWPCKEKGRSREQSVSAAGLTTKRVGDHVDLIAYDDIVTDEHRNSRKVREEARIRYSSSRAMLRTENPKATITGTPYHVRDLYKILEDSGDYKVVIIWAGGKHVSRPLSLPKKHSQAFLDRKLRECKGIGDEAFYWLQYQIERKASNVIATQEEWLKYCTLEDWNEACSASQNWGIVIMCDPAWKGSKQSGEGDYAAIAAVGIALHGYIQNRYLLELVHSNELTSRDGANQIFRLMKRWATQDVAVEEHGGYTFRGMLEDEAQGRGQHINLIDLKTKTTVAKANRIVTFLKHVESGNFFILKDSDYEPFVAEFLDYTPSIDHDDCLDAVAYSCDPNVIEQFSVPFAIPGRPAPHWARPADGPVMVDVPRTRYCTN